MTISDIKNKNGPNSWGTVVNFVWATFEKKIFERLYLSQETRYRALTLSYGFKIVPRVHNIKKGESI